MLVNLKGKTNHSKALYLVTYIILAPLLFSVNLVVSFMKVRLNELLGMSVFLEQVCNELMDIFSLLSLCLPPDSL